jgi:hypothetical protein
MKLCFILWPDAVSDAYIEGLEEKANNFPLPVLSLTVRTFEITKRAPLAKVNRGEQLVVIDVDQKIPPFWMFGFVFLALAFIFKIDVLGLIGFLFLTVFILWTRKFPEWAFKRGLRRYGYKQEIITIKNGEALEVLINGTARGP